MDERPNAGTFDNQTEDAHLNFRASALFTYFVPTPYTALGYPLRLARPISYVYLVTFL